MKFFPLALIAALLFGTATRISAQDHALYWKYKDYDGAIAISVPAVAIDIGSWFLKDKADRKLMRKLNKVRVLVFDDNGSPITKGDIARFERRAQRHNLEDLVTVRSGSTHVRVLAKERRGRLRKVVVFVNEPDTFVLVSVKGRLRIDDLNRVISKFGKDIKTKDNKPVVPEVVKLPVSRV